MTTYSQVGQDRWVLNRLGNKRNGYFIELGGGDGIKLSNTYLLEKEYGWDGVLIEPSFTYEKMKENRSCQTFKDCISGVPKETQFLEGEADTDEAWGNSTHAYSSGIADKFDEPLQVPGLGLVKRLRPGGNLRTVQTRTLASVLGEAEAPKEIDYLSLDVEGYEYDILSTFPFDQYDIKLITVEINGDEAMAAQIGEHLDQYGYKHVGTLHRLDYCYERMDQVLTD